MKTKWERNFFGIVDHRYHGFGIGLKLPYWGMQHMGIEEL